MLKTLNDTTDTGATVPPPLPAMSGPRHESGQTDSPGHGQTSDVTAANDRPESPASVSCPPSSGQTPERPEPPKQCPISKLTPDRVLGRGRSGIVFETVDGRGQTVARKVFHGDPRTRLVHCVLSGAENPYVWNDFAIQTAFLRRRILQALVEFWFDDKLRVAAALEYGWNCEYRAFELRCELIRGRHAALCHPFSTTGDDEARDAVGHVMEPLQAHLAEAGFDGLVFQAGRSNPAALSNFLCVGPRDQNGYRWVWIDLESGMPGMLPINPADLIRFYLPKCLKHGRPLLDDVDVPKLREYVLAHSRGLMDKFGTDRVAHLGKDIDALERNQREWKGQSRLQRSINHGLAKAAITREQADWYGRHAARWYARQSLGAAGAAMRWLGKRATALVDKLAGLHLNRVELDRWLQAVSLPARAAVARKVIESRIDHWQERAQLTADQAETLRGQLAGAEPTSYITDVGVMVSLRPTVRTLCWAVAPLLWALGMIGGMTLAVAVVAGGAIFRTVYTLSRQVENSLKGRRRPWVALVVGAAPVAGDLGYPLQAVRTGPASELQLAEFLACDTLAGMGRSVPLWGGPDSRIEHAFNRLATRLPLPCFAHPKSR
ncbi:MAG: hypothetical protein ACE5EX_01380 [Phycisphaerae bacterium]